MEFVEKRLNAENTEVAESAEKNGRTDARLAYGFGGGRRFSMDLSRSLIS
jgi:hypothetical protein